MIEKMLFYMEHHPDDTFSSVMLQIMRDLKRAKRMNLREMAEMCHSSPSTLSRMVRLLDYPSFSAFKCDLAVAAERKTSKPKAVPEATIGQLFREDVEQVAALQDVVLDQLSPRLLERVTETLCRAETVYLYLSDTPKGHMLLVDLIHSGIPTRMIANVDDEYRNAKRLMPNDVVLLVSGRRDNVEPKQKVIKQVHDRGAALIALTIGKMDCFTPSDLVIELPDCETPVNLFLIDEVLRVLDLPFA